MCLCISQDVNNFSLRILPHNFIHMPYLCLFVRMCREKGIELWILFTWGSEITSETLSHYTYKQISCKKIISELCFVIVQHRASICTSCFSYQNLLHKINFTKQIKKWMENCVIYSPSYCYKLWQKTKRDFFV